MWLIIVLILVLTFITWKVLNRPLEKSLENRHVLITGGSTGIGKCVAILAAKKGAHVSIIARNMDKLNAAKTDIELHCNSKKVSVKSADVSDKISIEKVIEELENEVGPIYMLVNCAGMAICGKLEDMKEDDIRNLINVNLLGTVFPTQVIIPKLKQRQEGIIVMTASAVALMGMFGYSIYSACKFGLRGLAESIYMEAKPYNISVTLGLPPDTDTPGFENENKTKPIETKLLSESAGLFQPEVVAEKLLSDALQGKFFSYVGFESSVLATLCVGMSPFSSVIDLVWQSLILGPLRLMAGIYVKQFEGIVLKCFNEKKVKQ